MIDTHCHIIPKMGYKNIEEIMSNAKKAGVVKMICIGCTLDEIEEVVYLKKNYENIYASIALHPEVVKDDTNIDKIWNDLRNKIIEYKDLLFAIGECGLDFHFTNEEEVKAKQIDLFKRHIELSIELDKPLIIHTRDAWDETFKIFEELNIKKRKNSIHTIEDISNEFPNIHISLTKGIIHSFTGTENEAKKSLDYGFKLGINGIVTFKKSQDLRNAVLLAGKENILLETDSPFLTPEPYRGQRNEPARIKEIGDYLTKLFS